MEYEHIVWFACSSSGATGSLDGQVEANIEQFSSIEFAFVIGLFDDVNVVIG